MTYHHQRDSSAIDRQRKAIEDLDVPAIGKIVDKRRMQGSTHWETWEFCNNIAPISKAAFDETVRQWEDYEE